MCSERSNPQDDPYSPTRTCCVCRKKDPRGALLRFVFLQPKTGNGIPVLAADLMGTSAGRGVYVHPQSACCARVVEHCRRGAKGRKVESARSVQEMLEANLRILQEGVPPGARASDRLNDAVRLGSELLGSLTAESKSPMNRKIRL